MLALLLGGGAIYLVIGDIKDALILLVFATLFIISIGGIPFLLVLFGGLFCKRVLGVATALRPNCV